MKAHGNILKRARIALSQIPGVLARAFPNAQGQVVAGDRREWITKEQTVRVFPGDVIVRGGVRMTVGMGPGTGDLIGFVQVTITAADVGRRILQFASFEGKTENDRLKPGQREWDAFLRKHGGVSVEVRDPDDAVQAARIAAGAGTEAGESVTPAAAAGGNRRRRG